MQLQLLSSQQKHFENIIEILNKHRFCIDTSPLGTGKTYTGAYIAQNYDNVYVISTKTIILKWKQIKEAYNIHTIKNFIVFNNIKRDFTVNGGVKEEYRDIKGKVLFIVDESQNFKNNSKQTSIFTDIISLNTNAHFLYLSGSPFDKTTHVHQYLKLFGIVSAKIPALTWIKNKGKMVDMNYVLAWTWLKNNGKRFRFKENLPFEKLEEEKFHLMREIFDILGATMEDVKVKKLEVTIEHKDVAREKFFKEGGNNCNSKHIIENLICLEENKLPFIVKDCKDFLKKGKKVVVFINFHKSVKYLESKLKDYKYGIITGLTSGDERSSILAKFSEPNNDLNLIIGNLTILSTGIDLDDKDGNFPRVGLISPNLNGVTIFQTINRFNRIDTQSDAQVKLYYLKIGQDTEFDYLNLVQGKMYILEDILGKNVIFGNAKNIPKKMLSPLSRTPVNTRSPINSNNSFSRTPPPIKIKKVNIMKKLQGKKPVARNNRKLDKPKPKIPVVKRESSVNSMDSIFGML